MDGVDPHATPEVVGRVLPYGDRALLVELAQAAVGGQRELGPAARKVLVGLDRAPTDRVGGALRRLVPVPVSRDAAVRTLDLPVVFDGPDLAEVAELVGRTVPAVRAQLEKEGGLARLQAGLRREKAVDYVMSRAKMTTE